MSPRAAWRLETLGFEEVYDYVAGKVDWLAAGWPSEGKAADVTKVATLADRDVATCALDEKVGEVRDRLGPDDVCVVVNDRRVVLGLVDGEDLGDEDDERPVGEVMQDGPSTIRPNVTAAALAEHLEHGPTSTALVTTPDGVLVGLLRASALEAWAEGEGQSEVGDHHHG
jgi:predicted transcriptional regulator